MVVVVGNGFRLAMVVVDVMRCDDDVTCNPWVPAHGTHTHEYGYGFHAGVGVGGGKNTRGLPMTSTT